MEQVQAWLEELKSPTMAAGVEQPMLEGWRQAVAASLEEEGYFTPASVAWAMERGPLSQIDDVGGEWEEAKTALSTTREALGAVWMNLRRGGFELGQSPGGHWRIHRLIYGGSWVLDRMLAGDESRPLVVGVVAARMLRQAVAEGGQRDERGWIGEFQAPLVWDRRRDEQPWRREAPPRLGALDEQSGEVIDWLLGQVVARVATSLCLEATVQVDGDERRHEVDDQLGEWALSQDGEMSALIMGALFSSVRLGGAERAREGRFREACRRATTMAKVEKLALMERHDGLALVEQIDGLRGRPTLFERPLRCRTDGGEVSGRLGVIMEVPRRGAGGGVAAVMGRAGFFADDPEGWQDLGNEHVRQVRQQIARATAALDEALFERFGDVFDAWVEKVVDGTNLSADFHSPLWTNLAAGEAAMRRAAEDDNGSRLQKVMGEWTVQIGDVDRKDEA